MNTHDCITKSESTETTGGIELDGESWKEREDTTYTSLLDLYEVSDLFSEKITNLYENKKAEEVIYEQELMDYVVSGAVGVDNQIKKEDELIEYIFSQEINLSKVKEYDKGEYGYTTLLIMAGIFVIFAFGLFMVRFNIKRQNRREKYGIEINMED